MEHRVLRTICAIAAQTAIAAQHFKARMANAAVNRLSENTSRPRRKPRFRGNRPGRYTSHYGAQAAARNLRHMKAGTHGTLCTVEMLRQRRAVAWE